MVGAAMRRMICLPGSSCRQGSIYKLWMTLSSSFLWTSCSRWVEELITLDSAVGFISEDIHHTTLVLRELLLLPFLTCLIVVNVGN